MRPVISWSWIRPKTSNNVGNFWKRACWNIAAEKIEKISKKRDKEKEDGTRFKRMAGKLWASGSPDRVLLSGCLRSLCALVGVVHVSWRSVKEAVGGG